MFKSQSILSTPALLKRFALIYLPVLALLSITLFLSAKIYEQTKTENLRAHESSVVMIAADQLVTGIKEVDADLRVIANLPLLQKYLDTNNNIQRGELEKLFLVFSQETMLYDQIRYLDVSGQEIIRINFNNNNPAIVPQESLQNKAGRYYFDDTLKLNRGDIFVSPLDLNVEQGSVELPHKPMIRFGTPVFDSAGRKRGIILLNYLAENLLNRFRSAMQANGRHFQMLLNSESYWLSSNNRDDEWGFMLGNIEQRFENRYPGAWRRISSGKEGVLLTTHGMFTYATVYPLAPEHHSSTGSILAKAASEKDIEAQQYYWKVVSFIPTAVLSDIYLFNQAGIRILIAFVYLLFAIAAWIITLTSLNRKHIEEMRRISTLKYQLLFESSRDALMILTPPLWNLSKVNASTLNLFNVSNVEEFSLYKPEDISPERQLDGRLSSEAIADIITETMNKGSNFFEWECQRLDGQSFTANIQLTRMDLGEESFLQATVRDISESKKAQQQIEWDYQTEKVLDSILHLAMQPQKLPELLRQSLEMILSFPQFGGMKKGCIFLSNKDDNTLDMVAQLGLPEELLTLCNKVSLDNCLCGRAVEERRTTCSMHVDGHHEIAYGGMVDHGHYCVPLINGEDKLLGILNTYIVKDHEHKERDDIFLKRMADTLSTMIERKQMEMKLDQMAHNDALTGLPNRALFFHTLSNSLIDARRHKHKVAVLFLDLDRFKLINDTLGHDMGDALLVEVASRLQNCTRESDTVARMGGDEFTIVLTHLDNDYGSSVVAKKVIDVLTNAFILNNQEHFIGCSIGIAEYPIDGETAEILVRNADEAMYAVKNSGRNNFLRYKAKA